jgi:hypothetical protein
MGWATFWATSSRTHLVTLNVKIFVSYDAADAEQRLDTIEILELERVDLYWYCKYFWWKEHLVKI